nr:AAA family ATPase [Caballeronia sp. GAWG1-1]
MATKKERLFVPLELDSLINNSEGISREGKSLLSTFFTALNAGADALSEYMGKQAFAKIAALVEQSNKKTARFAEEVKLVRERLLWHELALAHADWVLKEKELTSAAKATWTAVDERSGLEKQIQELERTILEHRQPADDLNLELRAYLGHDEIKFAVEDTGYRLVRQGGAATNLSEGHRHRVSVFPQVP